VLEGLYFRTLVKDESAGADFFATSNVSLELLDVVCGLMLMLYPLRDDNSDVGGLSRTALKGIFLKGDYFAKDESVIVSTDTSTWIPESFRMALDSVCADPTNGAGAALSALQQSVLWQILKNGEEMEHLLGKEEEHKYVAAFHPLDKVWPKNPYNQVNPGGALVDCADTVTRETRTNAPTHESAQNN
jgi:hypothetical protein